MEKCNYQCGRSVEREQTRPDGTREIKLRWHLSCEAEAKRRFDAGKCEKCGMQDRHFDPDDDEYNKDYPYCKNHDTYSDYQNY